MDTRRTMIAPKTACFAGSLALLLTTAISVLVIPGSAEAQVRATKTSASTRSSSARRSTPPTRRASTPVRKAPPLPTEAVASPSIGPAAIRAANAEALAPSRADGFVNAAQVFNFEQGRVYEVWTAPMRITALTLEPGERIINKAAGDTERWMIGDTTSGEGATQQSQILIKPYRAGIATNMVIATNRRLYLLSLRAGENTEAFNAIVTWTYANALQSGLALASTTGSVTSPAAVPNQSANIATLNQNYRIRTGWRKPAWTPISVSDDGRQTFITFPDNLGSTEAPPLFVMGDNGEAQLTNWRKQGAVYVVDRLFKRAELRLGGDSPRIVRIDRKGGQS
jgi:type IV secretion system protein TrbG